MSNIYKKGENRKQQMFFPPSIDEYVGEDNQVRAIEDYVELLDMRELGFTKSALNSSDGQPAYHPRLLLKIYIYGYLNKIRSSRKLETEIKRNIEMMWLCSNLKPSYKTIANFRKENNNPLKKVFREFVLLCKDLNLITGDLIAIDGAFLRANASKNQLIIKKNAQKHLKKIDEKIEEYLRKLEFTDKEEKKEKLIKPLPTNNLPKMRERKAKLNKDLAILEELGVTQYNRTDPDAKIMIKPAHNLIAYNSQIAVDSKFKFIIATDVSSRGNDMQELYNMAKASQEIIDDKSIPIVADSGYYSAKELKKCHDDNIDVIVPIPNKEKYKKEEGLFSKINFLYEENHDRYLCPNNQYLYATPTLYKGDGKLFNLYRISRTICRVCPLKNRCIPNKTTNKTIKRWEHQNIIEQHIIKMKTDKSKKAIKQRGSLAEHPFGTIKQTLGWSHFLVRGIEKVSGENALIMFTYNFRRLLNLIGIALFRKLIIALKSNNIEDIEAIKSEIVAYISMILLIWLYFFTILRFYVFKGKKLLFID